MKDESELRRVEGSLRDLYRIFPDGDVYEKLSVVEKVIEWVLAD